MTIAELRRAIESKKRMREFEAKQKAINDYRLADLIGRSIARLYSSSAKMPTLSEVYPDLFNKELEEEEIAKQKDVATEARLRQFAQFHNKKFNKEESKNNV